MEVFIHEPTPVSGWPAWPELGGELHDHKVRAFSQLRLVCGRRVCSATGECQLSDVGRRLLYACGIVSGRQRSMDTRTAVNEDISGASTVSPKSQGVTLAVVQVAESCPRVEVQASCLPRQVC